MTDRKGTLGTVEIVLAEWKDPEERYDRSYIPVGPASRTISGDNDQIAPETDIATWLIDDFSAGEGDIKWKDRGRYSTGGGVGPVNDGSGVSVGANWDTIAAQSVAFSRGGRRLVAARDMDDDIYSWNPGAGTWTSFGTIGGNASHDAIVIAAIDSSSYFVLSNNSDLRKVSAGANSAHYSGSGLVSVVAWGGTLYGISNSSDLYSVDTATADTKTIVHDVGVGAESTLEYCRLACASDVGPVWFSLTHEGRNLLFEYNVADATGYTVGELPPDSYVYDVAFIEGIYFAAFRYSPIFTDDGDAYLWFKKGATSGLIGPFRTDIATGSQRIAIAGAVGDRIYIAFQEDLWAYDLTDGALVYVADLSSSALAGVKSATTYGNQVLIGGVTLTAFVTLDEYLASTAQTLSTGSHDYGYLGIEKMVHTVTVSTEAILAASDTVEIGYSVDGGSVTYLSDDFATGEAVHQWNVSTSAGSTVKGTNVEWYLRLTTTSTTVAAKVVSIASDVSGAKSRIQFTVAVDLGESSTNDNVDVLTALKALKTSHATVQWSDPMQVRDHVAPETFDVRVMRVSTPELLDDGYASAIVTMQTVGFVG